MSKLIYKTGTEGSKHDPYGYERFGIVRPDGSEIKFHVGLGEWCSFKTNNETIRADGYHEARALFKRVVGFEPERLLKIKAQLEMLPYKEHEKRCKGAITSEFGYPGETLYVCNECKSIIGSDFNRSAIE